MNAFDILFLIFTTFGFLALVFDLERKTGLVDKDKPSEQDRWKKLNLWGKIFFSIPQACMLGWMFFFIAALTVLFFPMAWLADYLENAQWVGQIEMKCNKIFKSLFTKS